MSDPSTRREPNAVPMGFTKEQLPGVHHVCVIYSAEEERRRVTSEYLAAGITEGELVRYLTDVTPPDEIRAWLRELGVEPLEAEQRGAFGIVAAEDAYCPGGRFEPEGMIERNLQRYEVAEKAGYCGTRVCGEMSWALKGRPGSERLLEYEALLNTIDVAFPRIGMCQYDARLFDGATLFQVLQLHPHMVAKGQLVRNPYYTRPEEFLATRATTTGAGDYRAGTTVTT